MKNYKFNFTFLIVNFNGQKTGVLRKCLLNIKNKKLKKYQIIICDNGSTDDSIRLIKSFNFKNIKLIVNKENIGPSAARENATKFIAGFITIILDNDAYLHKVNFSDLKNIYLQNKKLAIIQPLIIINNTNLVDYFGDYITSIGFLQQNYPQLQKFNSNFGDQYILSAKSAAMFIRSDILKGIGFDKDYFIYVEETDLGWKCWLSGYYNIAMKEFTVKHGFGSTSIFLKKNKTIYNGAFYGPRNYLIMLFSNLELFNLLKILPIHIFLWIIYILFCLFIKFEIKKSFYYIKGILNFFININTLGFEKRKKTFLIRRKKDIHIFPFIKKNINFYEMILKSMRRPKVGNYKI